MLTALFLGGGSPLRWLILVVDSSNDESGDDVNLNDTNVENMEAGNINYDDVDDVDVGANENDHDDQVGDHDANINVVHVDIFDPKNWDNLTSDMIKVLVAEGPKRDKSIDKGFLNVDDTTGQGLFDVTQAELKALDLDIDDVRGQGYDNGSNMKGKHRGVQKKFLDINPRAFYTPCGCHSLNLTLCDMANTCNKAKDFFAIIQRIYTIFANSSKRWQILKDNVKGLTLKSLSTTRWESRVESKRVIRIKRHFDEAFVEEDVILSAEESFKVNYFLYIVDQAIASLTTRFEQYKEYEDIFGFLFTCDKLKLYDDDSLKSCCSHLEATLKNGDLSDINANELYVELR
ncbi:zinc finger MYM-type protein 1 [Tanacetum coccineum]